MLHWICRILLLVSLAPLGVAQDPAHGLDQARERWGRMSPAERARISQHFDEFRGLPEAERERMMSHLNRVAQARREIEARIPDELRAKLEKLAPEERHQVLREYVESTMGERAERLRDKMSPELLQKLQSATPAEREELIGARRDELRERGAPRALAYLGRQLQLPPEEIERIQSLPPEQKFQAIEELGRREMQRRGPPPGVDSQEFRGWLALPPPEFMERMHCHGMRGFRGDGGPPPPPGDQGGPPPEGRDPRGEFGRPDGRPDVRPEGRDGRGDGRGGDRGQRPPLPDGQPRGPRREGRLTHDAKGLVMRAMRPDSQWIIELAAEPREVRREQIFKRIHTRVVDLLRAEPSVTAEEMDRLETLQGREFFEALRDIVGDPMPGFGDRRRHDRSHDEPPPQPPQQR